MRVTWLFQHFFKLQVHILHSLENISIFNIWKLWLVRCDIIFSETSFILPKMSENFWSKEIPLWWFPGSTLKLNNSRTAWPIPAIYISFSSILNALSYEINLFSRCSSPLSVKDVHWKWLKYEPSAHAIWSYIGKTDRYSAIYFSVADAPTDVQEKNTNKGVDHIFILIISSMELFESAQLISEIKLCSQMHGALWNNFSSWFSITPLINSQLSRNKKVGRVCAVKTVNPCIQNKLVSRITDFHYLTDRKHSIWIIWALGRKKWDS